MTEAKELWSRHSQIEEEIAALELRRREVRSAALAAEEAERTRGEVASWEAIRTLYTHSSGKPFEACATSPRRTEAGPKRWEIGVGVGGQLLAVYEVTEYRGRFGSVRFGNVPDVVDLAVRSHFKLKEPGR